jgi:nucleoside-diphosphate-sugar epimerase
MRVLFIGATGLVGRQVVPLLKQRFDVTLAALGGGEVTDMPVADVNIADWPAVEQLISEGTDTGFAFDAIVNCAIAAYRNIDRTEPDWKHHYYQQCIEVNARGAYNIYEAAARAGIPRVIFISSMTAVLGSPQYAAIDDTTQDRPHDLYAACKVFGEHVGRSYAYRDGAADRAMRVLCLRLGHPYRSFSSSDEAWLTCEARRRVATHTEDIAQAIDCALQTDIRFGIYPIVSESDVPFVDPHLYAELGYRPAYRFTIDGLVPAEGLVPADGLVPVEATRVPVFEESYF